MNKTFLWCALLSFGVFPQAAQTNVFSVFDRLYK